MKRRSLEKHPNGYLYARIRGKRFNCGKNEREAYAKLKKIEQDIAAGKISFNKIETSAQIDANGKRDIHLDELAHLHLDWVSKNRSPGTYEVRQRYYGYFREFVGSCMVSEITRDHIERFFQMARQEHGRGVNHGHTALREIKTFLNWGVDNELCDLSFRRWPEATHRPPETRRFTTDEIGRLLKRVPADFRDMLVFAIVTGLRPREIRELTFDQVHIDGVKCPYLSIQQHKTASSARVFMPRSASLCHQAVEIIERQKLLHPTSRHVFLDADGHPYERNAYRKRLNRWCARAGIPERSPYALRHYYATIQVSGGTNLAVVAQSMGHSNIQTTMGYLAYVDTAHQTAANMIEQHILGLLTPQEMPVAEPV